MRATDYIREGETIAETVYRFLEDQILTEENTDFLIEFLAEKLKGKKLWIFPFPVLLVKKTLDSLLPEKLLEAIRNTMVAKGMISERRTHPSNPF